MTACPLTRAESRLCEQVARWSAAMGCGIAPGPGLWAERAPLLGLPAPTQVSANGTCRLLRAADGWLAVNLPRPGDRDLVPALLGRAVDPAAPWPELTAALPGLRARDVVAQAALLGMAVAALGETPPPPPGTPAGPTRPRDRPPRVVDLSALWAGPLCGALLAEAGCEVVKVETRQRPDTTATRSPVFDARLNGGKRRWRMDAADPADRARLHALLARADVVITSARPRALGWLVPLLPPACVWIAIRAHPDPARVGFGDDCAVAGGLVGGAGGAPVFLGDAAADPLTGLAAAAAGLRALAQRQGGRIDVMLSQVAAWAAHG